MSLHVIPSAEFVWHEGLTAAFACHLAGLAYTNRRRIGPDMPAEDYRDDTMLAFAVEEWDCRSGARFAVAVRVDVARLREVYDRTHPRA